MFDLFGFSSSVEYRRIVVCLIALIEVGSSLSPEHQSELRAIMRGEQDQEILDEFIKVARDRQDVAISEHEAKK